MLTSRWLYLLPAAMFGLAGYFFWQEYRDPWEVSVLQTDIDVGQVRLKENTTVKWTLNNRSNEPRRIVGVLDEPC